VDSECSKGNPRVACDAMCGGLARWLRVFGIDASFSPGVADADLVQHAQRERRVVVSADGRLFERRVFTTRVLSGLRLPVGLALPDQVQFTFEHLDLRVGIARCTRCNGELARVLRADVADVVPARSLIWTREFYRCTACGHVYWEGTHWRRVCAVRDLIEQGRNPTDGRERARIGRQA
jgi:uncharacterized protein with PIN domain